LKIIEPIPEVELLMFSKENSLEDISFAQQPQKEGSAMVPSFNSENGIV
tara:strand:+ start:444 stop:590 length:147 start_codon:yes stop_codon:yes gene_type:complete